MIRECSLRLASGYGSQRSHFHHFESLYTCKKRTHPYIYIYTNVFKAQRSFQFVLCEAVFNLSRVAPVNPVGRPKLSVATRICALARPTCEVLKQHPTYRKRLTHMLLASAFNGRPDPVIRHPGNWWVGTRSQNQVV